MMLEQVTERIFYLQNDDENDRPALGLIKGDNSCLLIDAGNSTRHAEYLLDVIKNMHLPPIRYVVVTHHHWDHILGLSSIDAIKIASYKTSELAKIYWGLELDNDSLENAHKNNLIGEVGLKVLKSDMKNAKIINEIKFDILFDGKLEIDLGGITCLIKEMVNPHRADGTIIHVPQEKTLFLGDSVYGYFDNGKNCYKRESMLSMIDEVMSFEANYYLCSHESICTKEEMTWYFDKLAMGLEITQGLNTEQEIINRFKEVYHSEPSEEDFFFLRSIYD